MVTHNMDLSKVFNSLNLEYHIAEGFCQITVSPGLVRKNINICLVGVLT